MSHPPPSDGVASGFLPTDWNELAPLRDMVLDAPAAARNRVLDEVSGGDPVRRAALTKLLADGEREMPLLDTPVVDGFPRVVDDAPAPQALLGVPGGLAASPNEPQPVPGQRASDEPHRFQPVVARIHSGPKAPVVLASRASTMNISYTPIEIPILSSCRYLTTAVIAAIPAVTARFRGIGGRDCTTAT